MESLKDKVDTMNDYECTRVLKYDDVKEAIETFKERLKEWEEDREDICIKTKSMNVIIKQIFGDL